MLQVQVQRDDHFPITWLEKAMLDVREDDVDALVVVRLVLESVQMSLQHSTDLLRRYRRPYLQIFQDRAFRPDELQLLLLPHVVVELLV